MKNTHIDSLYEKAEIAHEKQDFKTAKSLYKSVLQIDKNNYQSHRWLADVYLELEDYKNAIKSFKKALALDNTDADVLNDAGLAYYEEDFPSEAVNLYVQGIEISPNHECLHSNLGKALYEMYLHADKDTAQKIATKWMQDFPNNPDASFMGSAITGLNPAEQNIDFVRATFDDFASTFDEKLAELEYKAPELLSQALCRYTNNLGAVLDAGCGTGLVAPLIHTISHSITGVDLSGEMINLAKKRNLYTDLHTEDLVQFLKNNINIFDTIIAADVLCYFGDLSPVMHNFHTALKDKGVLAFSLEKTDISNACDNGFVLNASGRYKHTKQSIIAVLNQQGFTILEIHSKVLRTEHGKSVWGLVVIAQK